MALGMSSNMHGEGGKRKAEWHAEPPRTRPAFSHGKDDSVVAGLLALRLSASHSSAAPKDASSASSNSAVPVLNHCLLRPHFLALSSARLPNTAMLTNSPKMMMSPKDLTAVSSPKL